MICYSLGIFSTKLVAKLILCHGRLVRHNLRICTSKFSFNNLYLVSHAIQQILILPYEVLSFLGLLRRLALLPTEIIWIFKIDTSHSTAFMSGELFRHVKLLNLLVKEVRAALILVHVKKL